MNRKEETVDLRMEKRLSRLERKFDENVVNYYLERKESPNSALLHCLSYKIVVLRSCCLLFKLQISASASRFSVRVKIDGATAFYSADGRTEEKFVVPLTPGNKEIVVELSADEEFSVEQASVQTTGSVNYPDREYFLTVLNSSKESLVCFCYDDEMLVKRYIGGDFETLLHLKDVKCATICRMDDYYAIFYVCFDGCLKTSLYDGDSFEFYNGCTIDGDASSVCAQSGNPANVYAVKGNKVYKYTIDCELNCVAQPTDYKAWRVACEPSISDYIVTTDYNGKVKIIKTKNENLPTE